MFYSQAQFLSFAPAEEEMSPITALARWWFIRLWISDRSCEKTCTAIFAISKWRRFERSRALELGRSGIRRGPEFGLAEKKSLLSASLCEEASPITAWLLT